MTDELLDKNGGIMGKDEVTGQFLPGHKLATGRPKGARSFSTLYREAITKLALAENKTLAELEEELVSAGYTRAKGGDYRYYQDFLDRLHGKPVSLNQNLNVNLEANDLLSDEDKDRLNALLHNGRPTGTEESDS
jgi:hypothetical protein